MEGYAKPLKIFQFSDQKVDEIQQNGLVIPHQSAG